MKTPFSLSFQLFGFLGFASFMVGVLIFLNLSALFQYARFFELESGKAQYLNQLHQIRYHFGFARKEEKNWFIFKDRAYLDSRRKWLGTAKHLLANLRADVTTPEMSADLQSLGSYLVQYEILGSDLSKIKTQKQIESLTAKMRAVDANIMESISDMSDATLQMSDQHRSRIIQDTRNNIRNTTIIFILSLMTYSGLAFMWLWYFRRRIKALSSATQRIALGDYSPHLDTLSQDELGILASHFNEMASKISARDEKISQITQELLRVNNLLKKV